MSAQELCLEARRGRLNEVRRLVEREMVAPNAKAVCHTPLQEACHSHQVDVVQYLIEEAQADTTVVSTVEHNYGDTILLLACESRRECLPLVRYLVERVGMSVHDTNRRGSTPLHVACEQHNLALIKYLIEQAHADVNIKNRSGDIPLHCICRMRSGFLTIVRYLVESAGSNVNVTNDCGETPLHLICREGDQHIARYMVKYRNANVDIEDGYGESPILCLINRLYIHPCGKSNVLFFLSKVDSVDKKVLRAAYARADWDVTALVLRKYAVGLDMAGSFDKFPLHTIFRHFPLSWAAQDHFVDKFPQAWSVLDEDGRLPLHEALMSQALNDDKQSYGWVVSRLIHRLPISLLLRDPITGMYPFVAASVQFVSKSTHHCTERRGLNWFNTAFEMLRMNPVVLCHSSRAVHFASFSSECSDWRGSVEEEEVEVVASKRQKAFRFRK